VSRRRYALARGFAVKSAVTCPPAGAHACHVTLLAQCRACHDRPLPAPSRLLLGPLVAALVMASTSSEAGRADRLPATARAGAPGVPPAPRELRLVHFTVRSRAVHRTLPELLLEPRRAQAHRGLVLFLHADRGTEESTLSPELYAAMRRLGRRAPAMLFVGGGQRSYWHDRADGAWARYVLDEVLPAGVHRAGVDPRRVMVAGISMGAYGALDLARLHPRRFCAIAAHSPELWHRWRAAERAQPGGFDDRADFARHDLLRAGDALARQPIWIDAGRADGLARPGSLVLARRLRRHGGRVAVHAGWPGGHNGPYWNGHWDRYLRYDAAALRRCGRR
jgi:S-formylglutathione hydrolase FrmB